MKGEVLCSILGEVIACPVELLALAVTLHHQEAEGAPLHHPQAAGRQGSLNKEHIYVKCDPT